MATKDDDDYDELEVVWTGDMPLLPDRDQHPHYTYESPKRKYNKHNPTVDSGVTEDSDEDDWPEY